MKRSSVTAGVWPGRPGECGGGWGDGERDRVQGESRTRLGVYGVGRAAHQLGEYTGAVLQRVLRARNLNVKVTVQYR